MKPYKPDWYGRLKSGPFSERTFGRAQMARVEERLRRGDVGGRRGTRWVAWGFGAAAACALGALLLVKVAGLGPQPAVTVSPPPGTTAVSPTPSAAPPVAPQVTEAQALKIAKQHNPDSTVVWSATLDPAYKSTDPSVQGRIPVWNVVGQYPVGNKDAYIIDARTGKVLANREEEAPPLHDQAKAIVQMHMFDESHGWSLNAQGVWHTASGADGWTKVTPQGVSLLVTANGSYDQPRMAFIDDKTAVLAMRTDKSPTVTVYRTTDAGKTWSSTSFKSGWSDQYVVRELTFTDAAHGWLLISWGAAAGSEPVNLFATTDGGASWSLMSGFEPGKPTKPSDIPYGGDKSGIAFADAKHGYLSGFSAGPGPYFYGTSDAGATWNQIKLDLPTGIDPYGTHTLEPVFTSSSNGWLIVPFSSSDNQRKMLVYTTSDSGRSWKVGITVPDFPDQEPIVAMASTKIAYMTNGTQWYRISGGGSTIDTWTLPDNRLKGLRSLQFINEQVGYAVLDTRVWITRDGGHTWNMAW